MSELAALAQSLGLTLERSVFLTPTMTGLFKGRPLKLSFPADDSPPLVEYRFTPALDLGFEINDTVAPLGVRVVVGDADWDFEVSSHVDDLVRARALLVEPLRRAIIRVNIAAPTFQMNDERIRAHHGYGAGDVRSTIDMLVNVADRLDEARKDVPPAKPLAAHATEARRIAEARGFVFSATPFRLAGTIEDRDVEVFFKRTGAQKYRFFLNAGSRAVRAPGFGFGFRVRKQTLVDGVRKVFGAQDVEVGDARFDAAFLVEANDVDRAKYALEEGVRAALVDFVERFDRVTLDDARLCLEGSIEQMDPTRMGAVIATAEDLVDQVARASHRESRGPYR